MSVLFRGHERYRTVRVDGVVHIPNADINIFTTHDDHYWGSICMRLVVDSMWGRLDLDYDVPVTCFACLTMYDHRERRLR